MAIHHHGPDLYCTICEDTVFHSMFSPIQKDLEEVSAHHQIDLHPDEIERTGTLTKGQMAVLLRHDQSYRMFVVKYGGGVSA